jgi:predicted nucleic-acid-binding protein
LTVEHAEIVWQAPRKFVANKADVADGPIERCGHAAGCKYTATFVLNAIKTTGMKRLA